MPLLDVNSRCGGRSYRDQVHVIPKPCQVWQIAALIFVTETRAERAWFHYSYLGHVNASKANQKKVTIN